MSTTKFLLVFSVIFIFLLSFFVFEGFASSDEDAAELAINQAEDVVASAYGAILGAEQAGANVSDLLAQLNEAAGLLAKAQVAFRLGDFDEAVLSANHCSEIGESVKIGADELRLEAHGLRVMDSWLTITGSLAGIGAVVFSSFWGWHAFKRRYYRGVLMRKPEVVKGEP